MRGGKREGAGRKPVDSYPKDVRVTTEVSQEIVDLAISKGSGSLAAGLRIMLNEYVMGSPAPGQKSVKSISSKKPPVREKVPTHSRDGIRFNLHTRIRLEEEAEARYQKALAAYNAS